MIFGWLTLNNQSTLTHLALGASRHEPWQGRDLNWIRGRLKPSSISKILWTERDILAIKIKNKIILMWSTQWMERMIARIKNTFNQNQSELGNYSWIRISFIKLNKPLLNSRVPLLIWSLRLRRSWESFLHRFHIFLSTTQSRGKVTLVYRFRRQISTTT